MVKREHMKAIVSIVLISFILLGPAWASAPLETPPGGESETILNTAAYYIDTVLVHTLASLDLVASSPEARCGDWQGIKTYLRRLASIVPGVYFFVLPDGNYYSVEKDYTNLNLRNRGYFSALFAGNQVKGYPIYSRSTGKKSALMAAPIMVDGKATGALGASVFLEELRLALSRMLVLPSNYTWFVLNEKGNTMLDRDSDFIFMNPLAGGSPSLREAVSEALNCDSGVMHYELDGIIRNARYRKLPTMDWWMVLAKMEGAEMPAPIPLKLSLERFVPALRDSLHRIDGSLKRAIEKSAVDVTQEDEIRRLLSDIIGENPAVVNACYVDSRGVMRQIEPRDYMNFENSDISAQEHVGAMRNTPQPIFSNGFTAAEGFLAMSVARPLYDAKKKNVGSVSVLLRPELLVAPLLKTSAMPDDHELWIIQTDGMIIYDKDSEEIGRMLFSDPLYAKHESLLALGRKIVSVPEGKDHYIFLAPGLREKVIKHAVWQTVRLHGQEWRVVLAYRPYE